jgi:Dyp-type peroxidase family
MNSSPTRALEREDIQGLILRGYAGLPQALLLLLTFQDSTGFRAWLSAMADIVSNGQSDDDRIHAIHVALSHAGVGLAGLKPRESGFPRPFVEGMHDRVRADALGDVGANDPGNWEWGTPKNPGHALLMLYATAPGVLEEVEARQRNLWRQHGGSIEVRLPCGDMVGAREHFGFRDGIGQPIIRGMDRPGNEHNVIAPGEFILGYEDEYSLTSPTPSVPAARDHRGFLQPLADDSSCRDLGRNGTFLVVRQLEQHVARFWEAMKARATPAAPEACIGLASKMMGRWPGGAPVTLSPDKDDPALATEDRFGYREQDSDGRRCPFGSHVRRANPRDGLDGTRDDSLKIARRHRILRRGRSYGAPLHPSLDPMHLMQAPDDHASRGLHFICCNVDIERQFEFIQQTWVDNPKFAGLDYDPDPVVAAHEKPQRAEFTVPAAPVRERYRDLPPFVTLRGGSYFFLPGVSALRFLGALR